jgi:nicotinamidase-related amidase
MPTSGQEGPKEKVLEAPVGRMGLVSVHCWNLGQANGPYPIGPGAHCPGQAADWVPTAHHIINERIRPAMDAARKAGITVFHLAHPSYARKYPIYAKISADEALKSPAPPVSFEGCVRPLSREDRWRDQYGPDFPGAVWETHSQTFDIADAARPRGGEPVIVDGWQLNGLCRRLGIDTLIYVGFMADLCLVNISGAIREMSGKFGYRCIVLRDCTTAYEFADTYEGKWMTRAAIRLIETDMGYSALSRDFIAACERTVAEV